MSESAADTIVFISFVAFFVSIFALFKPLKTIGLGTQKRALIGIGLSLGMLIVGGVFLPKATPEQIAQAEAAEKAAEAESAAKANAAQASEEKAQAAEAAASADRAKVEAAASAERAQAELTAAAKGMWGEITSRTSACDQAGKNVAKAAGKRIPDVYELYPIVMDAKETCATAATNLSQISVPDSVPSEFRQSFKDSFDTCRDAYDMRSVGYDSMGEILNGDTRPSAVTGLREVGVSVQAGMMLCGGKFLKAVMEAHLPVADVMGKDFAAIDKSSAN